MRNTATPDDPGLDPSPHAETVFQRLHDDHLDIAERFGPLFDEGVPVSRTASLEALSDVLMRHLAAEEKTLYPALRKVGLLVSFAERMVMQHEVIRGAMRAAEAARDADRATFHAALRYLQRVFVEHVAEEEGSVFAYARANLASEMDAIARGLAQAETPGG
jgi:hemerythrin-like domain-containing protein